MIPKTIKSFVLRAGRISPRQQQGLDDCLPLYQLPLTDKPWSLETIFPEMRKTVVEIGFGMGDSLLAMAKAQPDVNFIGVEVHRAGIGSLAVNLHQQGLSNLRIAPYDAVEVFKTLLPDASLDGVQIFFPDPWPKKRHHKRRLIQPNFVQSLLKKIKVGGFIHCATDWEEYALHMMEVLSAEPSLQNTQAVGEFSPKPEMRPLTKFEARGCRLGHGVWDLVFIKK